MTPEVLIHFQHVSVGIELLVWSWRSWCHSTRLDGNTHTHTRHFLL